MQQDRKVADFLRNLMRRNGERRADAKRHRRHDGRGDDRTIDEVVEGVADEHGKDAAVVHFAVVSVAVAPEDQFLEDEERRMPASSVANTSRAAAGVRALPAGCASIDTPSSAPTA